MEERERERDRANEKKEMRKNDETGNITFKCLTNKPLRYVAPIGAFLFLNFFLLASASALRIVECYMYKYSYMYDECIIILYLLYVKTL